MWVRNHNGSQCWGSYLGLFYKHEVEASGPRPQPKSVGYSGAPGPPRKQCAVGKALDYIQETCTLPKSGQTSRLTRDKFRNLGLHPQRRAGIILMVPKPDCSGESLHACVLGEGGDGSAEHSQLGTLGQMLSM